MKKWFKGHHDNSNDDKKQKRMMLTNRSTATVSGSVANITQETTKLFYQGCNRSTLNAMLIAGIVLYIQSDVASKANLLLWGTLILITYLMRVVMVSATKKSAFRSKYPIKHLILFRISTTLCGCAWELSILILHTNDVSYHAFITMILAVICGAGAMSYSIDKITVFGFLGGVLFISGTDLIEHHLIMTQALALAVALFITCSLLTSMQIAKKLIENITLRYEEQKSKVAIYALAERQRLHIEHTPLAVIEWDVNLNISFWNAAATKMFGHDQASAIGRKSDLIATESNLSELHFSLQALKDGHDGQHMRTENIKKNGEIIHCEWFNTVLHDSTGEVAGLASLIQDETAYVKAKEEIEYLAYYDALTQLPNRRLLTNRIVQALKKSKRKKTVGCIMYIDLDNFKNLNDTHGHNIGDLLLCAVAQRLKKMLRDSDTVARLGGDEFVLLIEELSTQKEGAFAASQVIAEKVIACINLPFQLNDLHYSCTPSIGVSLFDHQTENIDELLRRADTAMYQSKQDGRNNYQFYDEAVQAKINFRAKLKNALASALAEQQLTLHFQPQVGAQQKIKGAETLLRWTHPEHGSISPAEFIPMAEESKLIIPIGNWVLLQACQQLKKWADSTLTEHLTLSVNVSAIQFNQANFIEQVTFAINTSNCNPKLLIIELTESAIVQNFEDIIVKMQALKAMGIALSMDDFGVGYSSLSVLKRLPLDELKIDRSFVSDLPDNQDSAVIAQTIIAMSHSLGLNIIAEGVETQAQADFLAQAGCENYQGYLFSKPVEIASFEKMLTV